MDNNLTLLQNGIPIVVGGSWQTLKILMDLEHDTCALSRELGEDGQMFSGGAPPLVTPENWLWALEREVLENEKRAEETRAKGTDYDPTPYLELAASIREATRKLRSLFIRPEEPLGSRLILEE